MAVSVERTAGLAAGSFWSQSSSSADRDAQGTPRQMFTAVTRSPSAISRNRITTSISDVPVIPRNLSSSSDSFSQSMIASSFAWVMTRTHRCCCQDSPTPRQGRRFHHAPRMEARRALLGPRTSQRPRPDPPPSYRGPITASRSEVRERRFKKFEIIILRASMMTAGRPDPLGGSSCAARQARHVESEKDRGGSKLMISTTQIYTMTLKNCATARWILWYWQ